MTPETGSRVSVIALPHPLRTRAHHLAAAPGATIDDLLVAIVEQTGVRPELLRHAAVEIDGRVVPKAMWSHMRPAPGTSVAVRALPGDDVASIFVQVLGLVAAFYFPPMLGLGQLGTALVRAGIAVSTSLTPPRRSPPPPAQLRP